MEWISIKDRLPELLDKPEFKQSKFVAVLTKDENFPSTASYEKGDGWEQWTAPINYDLLEVTHWIELPDMPNKK